MDGWVGGRVVGWVNGGFACVRACVRAQVGWWVGARVRGWVSWWLTSARSTSHPENAHKSGASFRICKVWCWCWLFGNEYQSVFTLEATQRQILRQSPTDATRFWWHCLGVDLINHQFSPGFRKSRSRFRTCFRCDSLQLLRESSVFTTYWSESS